MAKEIAGQIKLQIKGGAANPSPPVGPALGSKGINIMDFCKQFNARTQNKAGKVLPVVISYYADKSFDFIVKTSPVPVQLLEAAKVKSGSGEPNRKKVASVTWDQVKEIAEDKMPDLNCFTLASAMRMVAGTARITFTKFDASTDIDVRLGVDPRKANQMVRGVVSLPHGTGKQVRVLVLCGPEAEAAAKEAGAEYVGLDEYIDKIKGGWTDIDVIITQPQIMGKVGPLGRILGPRGLMPNPKSGTVTPDVAKAVKEVKQGKIDFKVDKGGIVHTSIGKVSFSPEQIRDNAAAFINTLIKLKPAAAKGTYIKSIYLSSTMSKGIKVDPKSIEA